MIDTKNPKGVKNVNAKQGPRTGNAGAHAGKRGDFQAAKAERAPLARVIESAYGKRLSKDFVDSKAEGISPNTEAKRFKR